MTLQPRVAVRILLPQKNPKDKNATVNGGHDIISGLVPRFVDPGVRVEAEKETKSRLKGELRHDNLTRNRPVTVDSIDERDAGSLGQWRS